MINQNINQRNKRSTVQVVTWRGKNTPFLLFSGPNIFFFCGTLYQIHEYIMILQYQLYQIIQKSHGGQYLVFPLPWIQNRLFSLFSYYNSREIALDFQGKILICFHEILLIIILKHSE